jgi:hypothetical protein
MNFDFDSRAPKDVKSALSEFVVQTLEQTPALRSDPLYKHVARLLELPISCTSDSESDAEDCKDAVESQGANVSVATDE